MSEKVAQGRGGSHGAQGRGNRSLHPPTELRRRLYWVLFAYALWGLGFEVVSTAARRLPAHDLTLALDRAIPLCPNWIWIYELAYLLPFIGMFIIERRSAFDHAVRAILSAAALAYIPYLLYPVNFERPALGDSLAERILALEYTYDAGSNQLPSLHVANAFLVYLAARRQWLRPPGDAAVLALAMLISASTLLVKQHIILDVVSGFALALLCHRITAPRLSRPPSARGGSASSALRARHDSP